MRNRCATNESDEVSYNDDIEDEDTNVQAGSEVAYFSDCDGMSKGDDDRGDDMIYSSND